VSFVGAKAAILIDGRLLVTLRDDRPDIPCPNMWDLPGGGCEGDETPEACMIRETREEVGLDLSGVPVLWKREFPAAHHPGRTAWFFVLALPATAEGQIRFGNEGQGWRLITPDEYRALPDAVPYLRERFFLWQDGQTALSRRE
jgi:8-oxo-dGTP diphosphatase